MVRDRLRDNLHHYRRSHFGRLPLRRLGGRGQAAIGEDAPNPEPVVKRRLQLFRQVKQKLRLYLRLERIRKSTADWQAAITEEASRNLFDLIDEDRTGFIDGKEIKIAVDKLYEKHFDKRLESELADILSLLNMDEDGDNQISYQEFREGIVDDEDLIQSRIRIRCINYHQLFL